MKFFNLQTVCLPNYNEFAIQIKEVRWEKTLSSSVSIDISNDAFDEFQKKRADNNLKDPTIYPYSENFSRAVFLIDEKDDYHSFLGSLQKVIQDMTTDFSQERLTAFKNQIEEIMQPQSEKTFTV